MLIIDIPMPENCDECNFSTYCSFCEGYDDACVLAPKDAEYEWNFCDGEKPTERPSWCPLKDVVRCKECKHNMDDFSWNGEPYKWCELQHQHMADDFYCADGERRN